MKISLETAKAHLRVDGNAEDALITPWIAAAYMAVEGQIFRKVYDAAEVIPAVDVSGIHTNDAINAAVLLIVGDLYAVRESQTDRPLTTNRAVEMLLTPYINHAGGD